MSELTPKQEADILRKVASKHPLLTSMLTMIDSTMPYGLEGMIAIQKDIEELQYFTGTDEEFTDLLRKKRKDFRESQGLTEDNNMTEEEEQKYKQIANLVKDLTKDNTVKK